jgi:ArsR family transcriptional regulator
MALLARHELTVAELVLITQLAQSSVSTHLGKLREAGLVRDRKAGASTFYVLNDGAMPGPARKVWELVRGEVRDALLEADRTREEKVVRAREKAGAWPEAAAGEMDRHWSPGRTWESLARAVTGLVRLGDVVDIGAGDGSVAQLLARGSRTYTCVDRNERMVHAARDRIGTAKNVRFVVADAERLPMPDAAFDQALMLHVLTQVAQPPQALSEVARVLRPGSGLVLVTLDAHEHLGTTAAYGDVHPGFTPTALRRHLSRAGLHVERCEVSCLDKRPPHFAVITAFATRQPAAEGKS